MKSTYILRARARMSDYLHTHPYVERNQFAILNPTRVGCVLATQIRSVGYKDAKTFDVATMMGGYDGEELFRLAQAITPAVAYLLPRNVDR